MVDCSHDRPSGVSFPHCDGTENSTGYFGCEESVDGHARLSKEQPLMEGSIRYMTVSDPTNVLSPCALEDRSTETYQCCRKTLLGTRM